MLIPWKRRSSTVSSPPASKSDPPDGVSRASFRLLLLPPPLLRRRLPPEKKDDPTASDEGKPHDERRFVRLEQRVHLYGHLRTPPRWLTSVNSKNPISRPISHSFRTLFLLSWNICSSSSIPLHTWTSRCSCSSTDNTHREAHVRATAFVAKMRTQNVFECHDLWNIFRLCHLNRELRWIPLMRVPSPWTQSGHCSLYLRRSKSLSMRPLWTSAFTLKCCL